MIIIMIIYYDYLRLLKLRNKKLITNDYEIGISFT